MAAWDNLIRRAEPADQPAIIELITQVYSEYGEHMCLDTADADLMNIAGYYFSRGGAFWVLESPTGRIVGTHAAHPLSDTPHLCTFRRLYLAADRRGTGDGQRLMQTTVEWAREQGFCRIEFWSDTRFHRAHQFFRKLGFTPTGEIRRMTDSLEPYHEYFFYQDL